MSAVVPPLELPTAIRYEVEVDVSDDGSSWGGNFTTPTDNALSPVVSGDSIYLRAKQGAYALQ